MKTITISNEDADVLLSVLRLRRVLDKGYFVQAEEILANKKAKPEDDKKAEDMKEFALRRIGALDRVIRELEDRDPMQDATRDETPFAEISK
jgi:hypothetical protein